MSEKLEAYFLARMEDWKNASMEKDKIRWDK